MTKPLGTRKVPAFLPLPTMQACAEILRHTFGASPAQPIADLLVAFGKARDYPRAGPRGQRGFDRLLTEPSPVLFESHPDEHPRTLRNSVHSWAYYHGHKIATRQEGSGKGLYVWMVEKAKDAR